MTMVGLVAAVLLFSLAPGAFAQRRDLRAEIQAINDSKDYSRLNVGSHGVPGIGCRTSQARDVVLGRKKRHRNSTMLSYDGVVRANAHPLPSSRASPVGSTGVPVS